MGAALAYRAIPRSDLRQKSIKCSSSGLGGSSDCILSKALLTVNPARNIILNASRNPRWVSSGTPLRSRPTLLTPRVSAGLPPAVRHTNHLGICSLDPKLASSPVVLAKAVVARGQIDRTNGIIALDAL